MSAAPGGSLPTSLVLGLGIKRFGRCTIRNVVAGLSICSCFQQEIFFTISAPVSSFIQ